MTLLIGEDLNILRVVFLLGKINKFSPARWNSPTIANFFSKVFGEKEKSTSGGVNKATSNKAIFLVRIQRV